MPNLLRMNETQFGGPNVEEPVGRKPDGRSQLNRLSKDRQAAVADYAATHTLPETIEWLNKDSQRSKLKLGLEVIAEVFRDHPEALKLYEQACKIIGLDLTRGAGFQPASQHYEQACNMIDVDRPPEEPPEPTTPPQNRPA